MLVLALLVMAGLTLFSLITGLILVYFGSGGDLSMGGKPNLSEMDGIQICALQICSHIFGLILPAFLVGKLFPEVQQQLSPQLFQRKLFGLIVLFFILCLPIVALSAHLNSLISLPDWASSKENEIEELIKKILEVKTIGAFIVSFITVAIIPAIGEEWIFRGVLQNQLIKLSSPVIGIISASVFFGAIHLQFEGILPRILLGLVLGIVYYKTQCLWYSILLHFLFNGSQVIIAMSVGDLNTEKIDIETGQILQLIGLSLICLYLLFLLSRKLKWLGDTKSDQYA